jgi:uncharacterized protein (TIGR00288 family)
MLGRRVRSALFIDFENVALSAETIANWLAWLEAGGFEPEQRGRRFLIKRVYWNSTAEKFREKYEAHGFEVVLCEKFATLKNGADIHMAMDIIETTHKPPRVDEYIVVTKDSDFIPVLQRLSLKSKRTAMLVDEAKPQMHTAYRQHADIIIPVRKLLEATKFVAEKRGLMQRLTGGGRKPKKAGKTAVAAAKAPAAVPTPAAKTPESRVGEAAAPKSKPQIDTVLETVVDRVIKVTSLTPKQDTASKKIMAELRAIPGFKGTGASGYFGKGSYEALMKEVARRDGRVKVYAQKRGGIAVQYVPPEG